MIYSKYYRGPMIYHVDADYRLLGYDCSKRVYQYVRL